MNPATPGNKEVDQFLIDFIDSIPHLESLLLLWNDRPHPWTVERVAARLYVEPDAARRILQDLAREALIEPVPGSAEQYRYQPGSDQEEHLIAAVDATYRRELLRVTTMIHSKGPSAVRAFARAFRFKKERD